MVDGSTPVGELKDAVARFVRARDWEQFHTPKNLTVSIAIEAAELMEIYQWTTGDESESLSAKPEVKARVEEELADVLIYCLGFANRAGIDVSDAVRQKLEFNVAKYPADQFRGRYR